MRIVNRHLVLLILSLWIFPDSAWAGVTRGIFGIPSIKNLHPSKYISQLKQADINAVFVPPDKETIRWYKEHGCKVYMAINAFGGKGAWKRGIRIRGLSQLMDSYCWALCPLMFGFVL